MELRFCLALHFRNDSLGKHFAQFDAPLVERINVPDNALGKNAVFIKSNEFAQRFRCEEFSKKSVGWAVTFEQSMGNQAIRCAFSLHLVGGLAVCQRYR